MQRIKDELRAAAQENELLRAKLRRAPDDHDDY